MTYLTNMMPRNAMVKSFGTFPHLLCPLVTTEAHIYNIRMLARLQCRRLQWNVHLNTTVTMVYIITILEYDSYDDLPL